MYDTVDYRWKDTSPYTGNLPDRSGVWTTVDYQVPSIIPLTCGDGRYSTIHSTYCHYYQI